jgi:hypothetical protein
MRLVAERLGVPLTADEVENLPMRQMFRSHMNRLLSWGVDESLYLALRTDCIEAWDERWEPIFRDAVERSL